MSKIAFQFGINRCTRYFKGGRSRNFGELSTMEHAQLPEVICKHRHGLAGLPYRVTCNIIVVSIRELDAQLRTDDRFVGGASKPVGSILDWHRISGEAIISVTISEELDRIGKVNYLFVGIPDHGGNRVFTKVPLICHELVKMLHLVTTDEGPRERISCGRIDSCHNLACIAFT